MASSSLMPCAYLNHGGGPLPLLGRQPDVASSLQQYSASMPKPKAILIVTAHWIEDKITVSSGDSHSLLFDYGGFPAETYQYKYPAPGSPSLAKNICTMLQQADIPCAQNSTRGWDHGVFVPLMLMYPKADVPVVAMSLHASLDAEYHIRIGHVLSSLRSQGVLILGSGASFHNFEYFFARDEKKRLEGIEHSRIWNQYLEEVLCGSAGAEDRKKRMMQWEHAPSARAAHPPRQDEHLIPLHVLVGVSQGERGHVLLSPNHANADPQDAFILSSFGWS